MQAGPDSEELMMSLFAEDGILIEPFSGKPMTFVGKDAIRVRHKEMVAAPHPPDFHLEINRIYTDGTTVFSDWTCTAPSVMPAPMKGRDEYVLRDGKIQKLEILLLQAG